MKSLKHSNGFTLIELMIVVVVISIIAAIAYPSYRESVMKSHRADAKASLLETAQILERCFTTYGSYNNTSCARVSAGPQVNITSTNGFYTITANGGDLTSTTFKLTATPNGTQAKDTNCAQFTLTHTGVKGATNSYCWD